MSVALATLADPNPGSARAAMRVSAETRVLAEIDRSEFDVTRAIACWLDWLGESLAEIDRIDGRVRDHKIRREARRAHKRQLANLGIRHLWRDTHRLTAADWTTPLGKGASEGVPSTATRRLESHPCRIARGGRVS